MLTSGANLKWTQKDTQDNAWNVHLICDGNVPFQICKEALFQFQAHVSRVEEQAKAQHEAQKQAGDVPKETSQTPAQCEGESCQT